MSFINDPFSSLRHADWVSSKSYFLLVGLRIWVIESSPFLKPKSLAVSTSRSFYFKIAIRFIRNVFVIGNEMSGFAQSSENSGKVQEHGHLFHDVINFFDFHQKEMKCNLLYLEGRQSYFNIFFSLLFEEIRIKNLPINDVTRFYILETPFPSSILLNFLRI